MHDHRSRIAPCLLASLLMLAPLTALAQQDERFTIQQFDVSGSAIFSAADFERLTRPYVGTGKVFGDIQKALDAVEGAYRNAGYSAVQVLVPEQELNRGVVRFEVIETPVAAVTVSGNSQYSTDNIRRSLPALKEGATPNGRNISESVQLANENQGKQVEVVLGVGKKEGTVDAKVEVKEDGLQRWYVNVDNTGTRPTGRLRTGVVYQHNNILDRDQTLTLSYTTSPDKPGGVKLDVFSIGYRVPFYALGDSLDVIYGRSNVNTPNPAAGTGAGTEIIGKGEVIGLRWNHYFARRGEYSSKLVAGFDWKLIEGGLANNTFEYLTTPLSATYSGKFERAKDTLTYAAGISHNIAFGTPESYNNAAGGRHAERGFTIARLSGSYSTEVMADWIFRVAANGQSSLGMALPASEQLGLTGNNAVRGFLERIIAADTAVVGNVELYTPELAPRVGLPGNLRALTFYDNGVGRDHNTDGTGETRKRVASWGVGLRYTLNKAVAVKFDVAQIVDVSPENANQGGTPPLDSNTRGDSRAHLSVTLGF